MSEPGALTNGEVQDLVYSWFQKITNKASLDEMLAMLTHNELGMQLHFPETTVRSHADFQRWYEEVTNRYFDQVHDLKMLAVDLNGTRATVTLVVNWQAYTWKPPAPYSEWQGFNVHQTWTVDRESGSGKPLIITYNVDKFDPMTNGAGVWRTSHTTTQ